MYHCGFDKEREKYAGCVGENDTDMVCGYESAAVWEGGGVGAGACSWGE